MCDKRAVEEFERLYKEESFCLSHCKAISVVDMIEGAIVRLQDEGNSFVEIGNIIHNLVENNFQWQKENLDDVNVG